MTKKQWRAWASYGFPTGDVDIATANTFTDLLKKLAKDTPQDLLKQLETYEDIQIQIAFTED